MTNEELKTALRLGPGSRELSDAVLLACGWTQSAAGNWYATNGVFHVGMDVAQSVDDALEFVPEDRGFWHVSRFPNRGGDAPGYEMWMYSETGDSPIEVHAPTLALAICAAVMELE